MAAKLVLLLPMFCHKHLNVGHMSIILVKLDVELPSFILVQNCCQICCISPHLMSMSILIFGHVNFISWPNFKTGIEIVNKLHRCCDFPVAYSKWPTNIMKFSLFNKNMLLHPYFQAIPSKFNGKWPRSNHVT